MVKFQELPAIDVHWIENTLKFPKVSMLSYDIVLSGSIPNSVVMFSNH